VICPGFSADCLETLDEIDHEGRRLFQEAGGGQFQYIPALNDNRDHLAALASLALEHLQGWLPAPTVARPIHERQLSVAR
jgi:ferrochelatase